MLNFRGSPLFLCTVTIRNHVPSTPLFRVKTQQLYLKVNMAV